VSFLPNNEYSIARLISILYRYGQGYIGKKLEPLHIGSGQYIFLLALYRHDGISQEELSDHLKIDKATTAKALKRLEEEGYVARSVDAFDKRAYRVFVTPKGMGIKPEVQSALRNWREILSDGLSEEEKDTALKLLKKMVQNVVHP